MNHADVTAVVLTYNGSQHVVEQLKSILAQTRLPQMLLVHDAKSTDNTVQLVESLRPQCNSLGVTLQVVVSPAAAGVARAFESAVELVQTEYLVLADQDDAWLPRKLEDQLQLLTHEVDLVGTDSWIVDQSLSRIDGDRMFDVIGVRRDHLGRPENLLAELARGNFISGMTMLMRTDFAKRSCPIPSGWIHDYWLAMKAGATGRLSILDEPTVLYRQHESNQLGAKRRLNALGATRRALKFDFSPTVRKEVDFWDHSTVDQLSVSRESGLLEILQRKSEFEQNRRRNISRGFLYRSLWCIRNYPRYRDLRRAWRLEILRDCLAGTSRSVGFSAPPPPRSN